jgi:predicted GH43/DUF377 family glycosyl hydrolase
MTDPSEIVHVTRSPGIPSLSEAEPLSNFFLELGQGAFNPAIINDRGFKLCAWRTGWHEDTRLHLGGLDSAAQLSWHRPLPLDRLFPQYTGRAGFEDPRLFRHNEQLWLAFTLNVVTASLGRVPAQAIVRLDDQYVASFGIVFASPFGRQEKNWQFFGDNGNLLAVYAVMPHYVGQVDDDGFTLLHMDPRLLPWDFGEPRGGTPPVRVGDEYFSFFHSSLDGIYHAGFYAFEATEPYRVTRWPRLPCLSAKEEYCRGVRKVVFPSGSIFNGSEWWVSYGLNDLYSCVARFKHSSLCSTLQAVI